MKTQVWVAFDDECVELCDVETWRMACGHNEVTETPIGCPVSAPDTSGLCQHCGRVGPDDEFSDPFAD